MELGLYTFAETRPETAGRHGSAAQRLGDLLEEVARRRTPAASALA